MEETTTMNTDKSLRRFRLCLCALVLALAGCTDHELPDVPSPSTEPAGLRFAVTPMGATTRVSYNGVGSMFDEGETIGCIIATRDANAADGTPYTYAANSRWTYKGGYLMLDAVFTCRWSWNNGGQWEEISNTTLIKETNPDADDGFLTIEDATKHYAFYFYYPYIGISTLSNDYNQAVSAYQEDASVPFYQLLQYPNCDVTTTTAPTGDATSYKDNYLMSAAWRTKENNGMKMYLWTAYPCFANHTQTSKAQINNSDFLWQRREGITSTSNQTINLRFQKKMANIEVDSDTRLTDVYFQATSDNALRRGKEINLSTGKITNYTKPANSWEGTLQEKNCYFTTTESILPYDNSNDAGTNYRLALPAQESFPCALHFTLNETPCKIDLSTQITRLDESTLYIIHITRKGETTLEIVDWENDHYEILDPDTDFQ